MTQPNVSLVVVNWNGRRHLETCLPALDALEYPADRRELIVVDNASSDDSLEWLRAYGGARVLVEDCNVGFAAACNRAAAEASGELVAFVNNDLRVAPRWLAQLVAALEDTGAAAAGSTILDWDGGRYDFDGASMSFTGHGASLRHGHPFVPARHGADVSPTLALFACGGAMIADRRRFLAAGGFDPEFFAYFEDVDLGWRLWVEGERVVHVPSALAYHRGHGSGLGDAARIALLERNALATIVKNYDDPHLAAALPAALLLVEARARAAGACGGALYRDTLVGFFDALPGLRTKRAAVQAARRRSDEEILPLFGEPLRPSFFGRAYWREQQRIARAFGLIDVFETNGASTTLMNDDFIADLQARIEELEGVLARERQANAERESATQTLETRLRDEIANLRRELDARRGPGLRRWLEGVRGRGG